MNGEDAPTTLIDLLDMLAEPPAPPPVAMTPQTWGWGALLALVLLALAWLAWRTWRHRRANAYRRAALAELAAAGDDPARIAGILRRTALAAWPRTRVASLTGPDWLAFLDATGGTGFVDGPGAALARAPYRDGQAPVPGLGDLAAGWVRRHRVEAQA
ncbi:DUF4381 domain-containing protein [Paroceanicella profunda]|uniref:DUF4381 domain-containing protein n=1 Tax=Paroceanicella profunda TaxID=2579971 RepID=A0A5B8FPJ9_9RHOB|nr:DUF4381 domain-containing protein [Paroceanicella profunda]QDL90406.1 DUF4381 domain-containing protein [Paroceanicella profunda]